MFYFSVAKLKTNNYNFSYSCIFFIRVTKARLDLLDLPAHQVPLVPVAPLGTQERTGHVALLESR